MYNLYIPKDQLEKRNDPYSILTKVDKIPTITYALSFYRSHNVLCRSKFFVSDQKFIYILWQTQTFWVRLKDDLQSVKLVFVLAQKFLKRH